VAPRGGRRRAALPPRAAGRATFPRAAPEAGLAPARRQEAGLAPRVDGEGHRALGLTEEREGEREDERTWQEEEDRDCVAYCVVVDV